MQEINSLGTKLEFLMRQANLKTTQLARFLQISSGYISDIINGNKSPSERLGAQLSEFFNVSYPQLMTEEAEGWEDTDWEEWTESFMLLTAERGIKSLLRYAASEDFEYAERACDRLTRDLEEASPWEVEELARLILKQGYEEFTNTAVVFQRDLEDDLEGRMEGRLRVSGPLASRKKGGALKSAQELLQTLEQRTKVIAGRKSRTEPKEKFGREVLELLEGTSEFVLIPVYDLTVSAGGGGVNGDHLTITEKVPMPASWMAERLRVNPEKVFCCYVQGDSMEPFAGPGDLIFVDRASTTPGDGYYVIKVDGTLMFKKTQWKPDSKTLRVISVNPEYEEFRIDENSGVTLSIVGRAVFSMRWI